MVQAVNTENAVDTVQAVNTGSSGAGAGEIGAREAGTVGAVRTVGGARTALAFPGPGFADPARDAQRAFRAVLEAMSHPTRRYPLAGPAEPPGALGRGLGAVALALLDEDCSVWLGGALDRDAEVASWIAFHTGVRRTSSSVAGFVIADPGTLPPLESLALGTDEAPHLSATVVLDIRGCAGATRFTARGPGIDGSATLAAPWATDGFVHGWRRNTELFPRGVDLLLVDADSVTAVPRTTRLSVAAPEAADQEAADPDAADLEACDPAAGNPDYRDADAGNPDARDADAAEPEAADLEQER